MNQVPQQWSDFSMKSELNTNNKQHRWLPPWELERDVMAPGQDITLIKLQRHSDTRIPLTSWQQSNKNDSNKTGRRRSEKNRHLPSCCVRLASKKPGWPRAVVVSMVWPVCAVRADWWAAGSILDVDDASNTPSSLLVSSRKYRISRMQSSFCNVPVLGTSPIKERNMTKFIRNCIIK